MYVHREFHKEIGAILDIPDLTLFAEFSNGRGFKTFKELQNREEKIQSVFKI